MQGIKKYEGWQVLKSRAESHVQSFEVTEKSLLMDGVVEVLRAAKGPGSRKSLKSPKK